MKRMSVVFAASALLLGLVTPSCEEELTAPLEAGDGVGALSGNAVDKLPQLYGLTETAAVKVFARGFNNPRGLKFGPDGYLYVAEAGRGGTSLMAPEVNGVEAPMGPYTGGYTARISRVSPSGARTTVAEDLPSSQSSPASGNLCNGVADLEFVGNTLYALLGGAGTTHGIHGIPNSVVRIDGRRDWKVVADLSRHLRAQPVVNSNGFIHEPDGTWYSMVHVDGEFYALEPNRGELVAINPGSREIRHVADIAASQGHCVPTAMAYRDGYFYVGTFHTEPFIEGRCSIFRLSRTGEITTWATGFTAIVGMAFDRRGRLYVLQNTTGHPYPTPGAGTIVRVNLGGWRETIVTGLSLPTALTVGPDGALYVSNKGYGAPAPGSGEILCIDTGIEPPL